MLDQSKYISFNVRLALAGPGALDILPSDPSRVLVALSYEAGGTNEMTVRSYTSGDSSIMWIVESGVPLILTWKDHGYLCQGRITVDGSLFPSDVIAHVLQYR